MWAVLAWAGMSTQRFREECFFGGCRGVWHARTMQISVSWQLPERFLWTHKEADLALHPVVGLVLHVGDTEMFSDAFDFKSLNFFFSSQQAGSMIHSHRGGWRWQETCTSWTGLHHQILFSPAIAATAEAILMLISAERVLSLQRVAPNYLKLVTCSNHWPFTLKLALMLLVLLVMILLFSVWLPFHMPLLCLRVCRWGPEVHHCCRPAFDRCRQIVGCIWTFHQMEMGVCWSWSISCMIFSMNKLNGMGDSKHHWRTPTVALQNSHSWLFKGTTLLEFSYSALMPWTSPCSMLNIWGPATDLQARLS